MLKEAGHDLSGDAEDLAPEALDLDEGGAVARLTAGTSKVPWAVRCQSASIGVKSRAAGVMVVILVSGVVATPCACR